MIKESKEYIEKYGRTDDIIMGIIMFWMVTSVNKGRLKLEYFNEKMNRYLDYTSTEVQMNRYKEEMLYSIIHVGNTVNTIDKVIAIIINIYGIDNLDYQLHMYGPSEDGSGDWWVSNKDNLMLEMSNNIFSIICSSNGISIVLANKMNFLDSEDWLSLYRNYNIDKIIL